MKNKKILCILAVLVVAVVVCVLLADPVYADVGNSFSGGGSDSSSGGGYSGGSGISVGGLYFLSDNPILLLIVIGIIIYSVYKNKNQTQSTASKSQSNMKSNTGIDEAGTIRKIIAVDEHFSSENFKNYAREVWLNVQDAWEEKDWHRVRPFESNTLFNVHNRQLQEYIDRHKTNYLDMQNIRKVTIASFSIGEDFEVIHVKLDASLLDYVVDDDTKQILEGSKTDYVHRSYDLEFIRKKGVKTMQQEGTAVTNCPNCGAPTTVTSSGQCEYCKSVITNGDFGWVLNAYGPWQ